MEIKREDHAWGVSLSGRPLAELGNPAMQIRADITPKTNRNPEIRVQFSAALPPGTLKLSDAAIWVNCLQQIIVQARAIAAELKNGASEPPSKRSTKKSSKR